MRVNQYGESDYSENVTYDSKNLQALSFQGNIGFLGRSFISIDHRRSVRGGEFQQEAINTQVNEVYGLEKFDGMIVLDALWKILAPNSIVLNTFFSTRFRYIRELTQTTSLVERNSIFPQSESAIDYENQEVADYIGLPSGTDYSFKANYTYKEITIRLPFNPIPEQYKNVFGGMRVGYARWNYERPFSTTFIQLNNRDVIYNASLNTHALVFVFETLDPGSPGLHIDGNLSIGVNNKIESNFDWDRVLEVEGRAQPEERKINHDVRRWELNLRYIIDPKPNTDQGINISLGASLYGYEYNIKEIEERDGDNEILTEIKNRDDFYRIWGLVSYRF